MNQTSKHGPSLDLIIPDLSIGDILLHKSIPQTSIQKIISKKSNSPYTHASIYLGDGLLVEASPLSFRVIQELVQTKLDKGDRIAVLRSQMGFSPSRQHKLIEFLTDLIENNAKYDFLGALQSTRNRNAFFDNQLARIEENFGKITTKEEFLSENYYCSELIVACYSVVGIIGCSAQVAYPKSAFLPGDLHRDPTFGWFLGYLVQADDPLLVFERW